MILDSVTPHDLYNILCFPLHFLCFFFFHHALWWTRGTLPKHVEPDQQLKLYLEWRGIGTEIEVKRRVSSAMLWTDEALPSL